MSFWSIVAKAGEPVDYAVLPEYLLTVRRAVLVPGSVSCALYLTSDNFDGKVTKALIAILRPNAASEQVELNLTCGFGEKMIFEVEVLEKPKEGQKPGKVAVSLTGFLHPFAAAFATGEGEEDEEDEEVSADR